MGSATLCVYTHISSSSLQSPQSSVSSALSFLVSVFIPSLSSSPFLTLIDCGASNNFIDFLLAPIAQVHVLPAPIAIYLFNGSSTPASIITHGLIAAVTVEGFAPREVLFYVTKLHPLTKLVLGLSWLHAEDPLIDWKTLAPHHARALDLVGRDPVLTFALILELYLQDPI